MIDKKDYIIKVAKNGDKSRYYKVTCDKCGADRGYKRAKYANIMCRKCATRKSGRKRAIHIYDNVNYNDFIEVSAYTKNTPKRISLKYKTKCIICKKDKGYSRPKDFKKSCLSCARKSVHKNMHPNTKKITAQKISCTQRNIDIEKFNGFSTSEKERAKNKFKNDRLSEKCLSNANYTCDVFGVRCVELHAHHKNSWAHFPDQRYDINNLVCLSNDAHKSFHYIYGKGTTSPVTEEQYETFKADMLKLIKIKQDLYLISGAPASGKSWVCGQLADKFNYISYDGMPKWRHIFELLKANNKPLLYDPTIKISTFIKRYGHLFNVHLIVIQESESVINERMVNRGGKITDTIKLRIKRMNTLAKSAIFSGTSSQVLEYLKTTNTRK